MGKSITQRPMDPLPCNSDARTPAAEHELSVFGLRLGVQGLELRVQGSRLRVQGL